jgi:hypothetical protein
MQTEWQRKQQADQRGSEQQGGGTHGFSQCSRLEGESCKPANSGLLADISELTRAFGYLSWPVDLALMFGLAASLGLLLASHVALSVGLAVLGPWQRGLIAFVVPPLAPFWGYHGKLHARSLLWLISFVTHAACLTTAAIGSAGS